MIWGDRFDRYRSPFQIRQKTPCDKAIVFGRKSAVAVLNQKGSEPQQPRLNAKTIL